MYIISVVTEVTVIPPSFISRTLLCRKPFSHQLFGYPWSSFHFKKVRVKCWFLIPYSWSSLFMDSVFMQMRVLTAIICNPRVSSSGVCGHSQACAQQWQSQLPGVRSQPKVNKVVHCFHVSALRLQSPLRVCLVPCFLRFCAFCWWLGYLKWSPSIALKCYVVS